MDFHLHKSRRKLNLHFSSAGDCVLLLGSGKLYHFVANDGLNYSNLISLSRKIVSRLCCLNPIGLSRKVVSLENVKVFS